jgi:hypothetical protein
MTTTPNGQLSVQRIDLTRGAWLKITIPAAITLAGLIISGTWYVATNEARVSATEIRDATQDTILAKVGATLERLAEKTTEHSIRIDNLERSKGLKP